MTATPWFNGLATACRAASCLLCKHSVSTQLGMPALRCRRRYEARVGGETRVDLRPDSFKSIGQLTSGPSTGYAAGHRRKISGCVPKALLARWGPSVRKRTKSSRHEGGSEHGYCKTGYHLFPLRDLCCPWLLLRHQSLPAWASGALLRSADDPPFGDAEPRVCRRNPAAM
jgi:hypothetical protein